MNFKKESNKTLAARYKTQKADERTRRSRLDELFSKEWEVFVIKKDRTTGRFIGKIACCALSPV